MADIRILVMPARACWTRLGFGIFTGTVAGTLRGLLTGPLGREALAAPVVDGPEGWCCDARWERLERQRGALPREGGAPAQGLVVFSLGADLAPEREGLLYGAKAWWVPQTMAVLWGGWGTG